MADYPGGVKEIGLGEGTMSRASGAHVPETGALVTDNVPRVVSERIPRNIWVPKVYDTLSGLTEMFYDASGGANNLIAREATFQSEYPEFTKVEIGTSFQSRPINAYRLGPVSRKHFVVIMGGHGNEIDGVEGTFRAFELLAREPEFQDFRDEWTLFLVTALNPDGWFASTRNTAEVGPNGNTINLNRNFDWFWDEYVETSSESKGSAAESTSEATAILDYWRGTGPFAAQGPVTFGFLMDQHANQGVGKRYQSRDRVWRNTTQDPSSSKSGELLPGSYLSVYLDFYTWRAAQAVSKVRADAASGTFDYAISYRRSRFRPHLHSYFSSQGVPSIATEEVKVADAFNNLETFSSAANFRLDYTIAAAAMVTSTNWEWKDGLLVENAAANLLKNSHFEQWQTNDERPGNYTTSRSTITRDPEVLNQTASGRHFDDSGESMQVTSNTDVKLRADSASPDVPSEYTASANAKLGVYAVLSDEMTGLFKFDIDAAFDTGFAGDPDITLSHSTRIGAKLGNSGSDSVDIIGGGTTAPSTGASTAVSRVTGISTDTPVESSPGTLNTARMFHASADNFLDFPTSGNERVYVFGGYDGVGTRLQTIETWNPNAGTSSNSAVAIPGSDGLADAVAVFHPPTGNVYIFWRE